MPELAILLARTLSISTFSTSLLRSLFQISAKFSLLLLVLLLTFKITDSLRKAFSKRAGRTVFQNFLLSCQRQLCLWSSFPPKKYISFAEQASFDVFITAFLSSFVITLQLFERIYAISWSVLVKNR